MGTIHYSKHTGELATYTNALVLFNILMYMYFSIPFSVLL